MAFTTEAGGSYVDHNLESVENPASRAAIEGSAGSGAKIQALANPDDVRNAGRLRDFLFFAEKLFDGHAGLVAGNRLH